MSSTSSVGFCTSCQVTLEATIPCVAESLVIQAHSSGNLGLLGRVKLVQYSRNALYLSLALTIIGAVGFTYYDNSDNRGKYSFMGCLIAGGISSIVCFGFLYGHSKKLMITMRDMNMKRSMQSDIAGLPDAPPAYEQTV